jgi:Na+/proline symporter
VRLDLNWLDYVILGCYFLTVLGIGWLARRSISSSLDFLLSGRALPAWVTGLAFVAANLGALEILAWPPTARSTASRRRTTTGSAPCRRWSSSAS